MNLSYIKNQHVRPVKLKEALQGFLLTLKMEKSTLTSPISPDSLWLTGLHMNGRPAHYQPAIWLLKASHSVQNCLMLHTRKVVIQNS